MKSKADIGTLLIKYRLTSLAGIKVLSVIISNVRQYYKEIPNSFSFDFFWQLALALLAIFILFLFERKMNEMVGQ